MMLVGVVIYSLLWNIKQFARIEEVGSVSYNKSEKNFGSSEFITYICIVRNEQS